MSLGFLSLPIKKGIFSLGLFFLGVLFLVGSCESLLIKQDESFNVINDKIGLGQYEEAVNDLLLLVNTFNDKEIKARAYFMLASIHNLYINNFRQAAYYYQIIVSEHQNSAYYEDALANLADIYLHYLDENTNHTLNAANYLKILNDSLTKLDSKKIFTQLKLADTYFSAGRYKQAVHFYADLIKLLEQKPDLIKHQAYAYLKIGMVFEALQMFDMAAVTYQEIESKTQSSLDSLQAAVRLSYIYETYGQKKLANQVYQSIIERLDPKNPLVELYRQKIGN